MRAVIACALLAALAGATVAACYPTSRGPCVNPGGQPVTGTQVSSPALECPSHICLLQPPNPTTTNFAQADGGTFRATCSALCGGDDDCASLAPDYCHAGYVCAVATEAGSFCCRKLCVCRSDLKQGFNVDADGGTTIPYACSSANPQPSCANAPIGNP